MSITQAVNESTVDAFYKFRMRITYILKLLQLFIGIKLSLLLRLALSVEDCPFEKGHLALPDIMLGFLVIETFLWWFMALSGQIFYVPDIPIFDIWISLEVFLVTIVCGGKYQDPNGHFGDTPGILVAIDIGLLVLRFLPRLLGCGEYYHHRHYHYHAYDFEVDSRNGSGLGAYAMTEIFVMGPEFGVDGGHEGEGEG